jgi:hypothetical protein
MLRLKMLAQFNFEARVANELSFKEGDIITLIEKHESGMWKGELDGRFKFIVFYLLNFLELDFFPIILLNQKVHLRKRSHNQVTQWKDGSQNKVCLL